MNALSTLVALTLVLAGGLSPHPNGKFFSLEDVPPGVLYQRAILWHGEGTETLLIQSQFTLQRAGIYDVQVVTATDALPLIDWLNLNEFSFTDSDQEVFKSCLDADWPFAVARVSPQVRIVGEQRIAEGLVAPLILRFEAEQPVFPMALTGTVGRDTEVLIYIYSNRKLAGDGRLEMHAALESGNNIAEYLETDPPEFFGEDEMAFNYITTFKGTLSPEQMQHDLVFSAAPDNEPYRRHLVRF